MRAWRVRVLGETPVLEDIAPPRVRPGTVRVCMQAAPLLNYLADYLTGRLPYLYPAVPFTPGTNGVGVIDAVGADVYHLRPGMRVLTSPHLRAHEQVADPAQVLLGLTGMNPEVPQMLADWPDGTLAEQALFPAANLTPLDGLEHLPPERLAALGKFLVPLGGLLRGRLTVGETLIVSGASGYFGSAAVLLGLALGAERVVAAGRNRTALESLAGVAGQRVVPVAMTGDVGADAQALRMAGGGDVALDLVGRAASSDATLAALRALRRGGRLVMMGSSMMPLPLDYREMLANDWEVIGNFMYRPDAGRRLVALLRGGLLDLSSVRLACFGMADLSAAMTQAATMRGLDCTVLRLEQP